MVAARGLWHMAARCCCCCHHQVSFDPPRTVAAAPCLQMDPKFLRNQVRV